MGPLYPVRRRVQTTQAAHSRWVDGRNTTAHPQASSVTSLCLPALSCAIRLRLVAVGGTEIPPAPVQHQAQLGYEVQALGDFPKAVTRQLRQAACFQQLHVPESSALSGAGGEAALVGGQAWPWSPRSTGWHQRCSLEPGHLRLCHLRSVLCSVVPLEWVSPRAVVCILQTPGLGHNEPSGPNSQPTSLHCDPPGNPSHRLGCERAFLLPWPLLPAERSSCRSWRGLAGQGLPSPSQSL